MHFVHPLIYEFRQYNVPLLHISWIRCTRLILLPRSLLFERLQILIRQQIYVYTRVYPLQRGDHHLHEDGKLFRSTRLPRNILYVLCGEVAPPKVPRELLFHLEKQLLISVKDCYLDLFHWDQVVNLDRKNEGMKEFITFLKVNSVSNSTSSILSLDFKFMNLR